MENSNQRATTFILVAQQEWALNLGSNAKNMAVEFSKHHPVLYVNPPIDLNTLLKNFTKAHNWQRMQYALGIKNNTRQVQPNLWVHTPACVGISINWLNNQNLFNFFSRFNAKSFFKSIKKAVHTLGWKDRSVTVFNDSQMFTGRFTKEYLNPAYNFYYIRDNLVKHPYFVKHGERVEPETISQADAVFANSLYLANYAKQFNTNSIDIGQGCELDLYDSNLVHSQPADISHIPHPRIGYAGFLTGERLDIKLLEEVAQATPNWHFVLIGPEEIMFKQSGLHSLTNVHFLGAKPSAKLPAYLQHMDVCMNPQLVNDLTIGNYPRKIDEYLALGKPTVATDTPAMHMFLPHVYLASGAAGYLLAIENALKPATAQSVQAAITFARSHTWQKCAKLIYERQQILNV